MVFTKFVLRRFSTYTPIVASAPNWVEMGPALLITKPYLNCNEKWSHLLAFKKIIENNKTYAEIKSNVPLANAALKIAGKLDENKPSNYDFLHLEDYSIWNKKLIGYLIGVLDDIRYKENTYSTLEHLEYFLSVAMPNLDEIECAGIREILQKKVTNSNKSIILETLTKEKEHHLRTLESLENQMSNNIQWFTHDKYLQTRLERHGFDYFVQLFPSSNFNILYYNQNEANVIKEMNKIVLNLNLAGFVRNYNGSIDFSHDDIKKIHQEINKDLRCDELTFSLAFKNLIKLYNSSWKDFVKAKAFERGIGLPQVTFMDGLEFGNENICLHHFKNTDKLKEKEFREKALSVAKKHNWVSLQTLLVDFE